MPIPDRWRQADLAVVIHIVSLTCSTGNRSESHCGSGRAPK
jgi:hypothetical protein